jgi:quinol-cytochrome oxidoreductase complex cytochrome b subunit
MALLFIFILFIVFIVGVCFLQSYIKREYGASIFDGGNATIVIVSIVLAAIVFGIYRISTPASPDNEIYKLRQQYWTKAEQVLRDEYDRFERNAFNMKKFGVSTGRCLVEFLGVGPNDTVSFDEFKNRYGNAILKYHNITPEAPASAIEPINTEYQRRLAEHKSTFPVYGLFIGLFLIGGILWIFLDNLKWLEGKYLLTMVVTMLQYLWSVLLLCGAILLMLLVIGASGARREEKRKEGERIDKLTKSIENLEKKIR